MRIIQLGDNDEHWRQLREFDKYSIYLDRQWVELVEKTFHHRSMYLAGVEKDRVVLALPAFLVRHPVGGSKLVSTAYDGCHGGVLQRGGYSPEVLIDYLIEQARTMKVKYVEIRSKEPLPLLAGKKFVREEPLLITDLALTSESENWQRLTSKHRRNCRAAGKRGVQIGFAKYIDEMREFYQLVSDHYKSIGVPFFSQDYFENIWNLLIENDKGVLMVARIGEKLVGAHLLLHSGRTLISKYCACDRADEYKRSYVAYALNWEAIKYGIDKGFSDFNFGVSGESNVGLLEFKNKYGSVTNKLNYYYLPITGGYPDLNRLYRSSALIKNTWRLLPSFVTQPVGGRVARWFC